MNQLEENSTNDRVAQLLRVPLSALLLYDLKKNQQLGYFRSACTAHPGVLSYRNGQKNQQKLVGVYETFHGFTKAGIH
jgi:cell division protein FtsX